MVTKSVAPATPSWCPLIRREIGPKAADAALLLVAQPSQRLHNESIQEMSYEAQPARSNKRPGFGTPIMGAFSGHGGSPRTAGSSNPQKCRSLRR